jgi:hypothetical protein
MCRIHQHERLIVSEKESVLTVTQARRVEALVVSRGLLVQTSMFSQNPSRSVDDLTKLAEWILGPEQERADHPARMFGQQMGVLEVQPEDIPGFLAHLAGVVPYCENPNCFIHGPANAAKDLDPDDAKSEWDVEDAPTDDGQERPDDTEAGDLPDMAEPSDFEGGEADTANEMVNPLPPGTVLQDDDRPIPVGDWEIDDRDEDGN